MRNGGYKLFVESKLKYMKFRVNYSSTLNLFKLILFMQNDYNFYMYISAIGIILSFKNNMERVRQALFLAGTLFLLESFLRSCEHKLN